MNCTKLNMDCATAINTVIVIFSMVLNTSLSFDGFFYIKIFNCFIHLLQADLANFVSFSRAVHLDNILFWTFLYVFVVKKCDAM